MYTNLLRKLGTKCEGRNRLYQSLTWACHGTDPEPEEIRGGKKIGRRNF